MYESINTIIKDFRYPYGGKRITQKELGELLGIPETSIAEYELEGNYVPHEVIIKYARYFDVSSDYILGLSGNKRPPKMEIQELGLSDAALEKLKSGQIDTRLLSDIIENDAFNALMTDASIYVGGYVDEAAGIMNSLVDFARDKVSGADITSPDKSKDEMLLKAVHASSDIYFSNILEQRFRIILSDIKEKYKNSIATSDNASDSTMSPILESAFEAGKEAKSQGKNAIQVLFATTKAAFTSAMQVKKNPQTEKALDNMLTNPELKSVATQVLSQSKLAEPVTRKRQRAARNMKKDK